MEKQFNLIIDTKRNGFNAVRGFKQEENNTVIYITLVQNSIPFDLNGLTVRINFKRPDGQVLLQMADVVKADEGKVKVKILTKVLKLVGEVKADLSIFNEENEKITSALFTMFIDAPIYTNDYILKKDEFDIIQRVWTSESERIKQEKERKENETNRKNTENIRARGEENRNKEEEKRVANEKQRCNDEKNRVKAETIREDSFNKLKQKTEENINIQNKNIGIQEEKIKSITKINEDITKAEEERKNNELTRQEGYTEIKSNINNFSICEKYNSEKKYKKFNRVTFNGSFYECLKDCINIEPTHIEYWICIAQKGKDGSGSGDMHTNIYDKNKNGKIDIAEVAESIEWDNIKNKPNIPDINKQVGDLNSLPTNDKTNIVNALKEVFRSGNNVKNKLVGALLQKDKNLQLNNNSTWDNIISNINKIKIGSNFAKGKVNFEGYTRITNLSFKPKVIVTSLKKTNTISLIFI
ncbi:DUF2479 domain-containing protein [Clostridium niameyense]|uniref:DUF2479 domain-containing protein n=1 Tax=Clostridium niameyense TaxID=1622073 RepID=A0A6M0R8C4_9CLOT|nr:BppU family phage baseplate upper protein [Clostridium niameyense]NEZ46493.1 DUF2479 domain-containing protein [Clostridium niameyense]